MNELESAASRGGVEGRERDREDRDTDMDRGAKGDRDSYRVKRGQGQGTEEQGLDHRRSETGIELSRHIQGHELRRQG